MFSSLIEASMTLVVEENTCRSSFFPSFKRTN